MHQRRLYAHQDYEIASGRVAYLARRGADYGLGTGELRIDMARIRQRKRDIVASFRDGMQSSLRENSASEVDFRRSPLHRCENRGNYREGRNTFAVVRRIDIYQRGMPPGRAIHRGTAKRSLSE